MTCLIGSSSEWIKSLAKAAKNGDDDDENDSGKMVVKSFDMNRVSSATGRPELNPGSVGKLGTQNYASPDNASRLTVSQPRPIQTDLMVSNATVAAKGTTSADTLKIAAPPQIQPQTFQASASADMNTTPISPGLHTAGQKIVIK